MSLKTPLLAALLFSLLPFGALAGGNAEEAYLEALKAKSYKCTDTPRHDGYFCSGRVLGYPTYVTIPKGMSSHTHDVFYAHGLVGVCGNGASGENYLKNYAPTLQRIGAIGIMPFRQAAANTGFPLASFLNQVEKDLGTTGSPLIMAGHSAAGSFLGAELGANPGIASRVDQALLIDAIYGAERSASLWNNVLNHSPRMKVKLVSSTTGANSRTWMGIVKAKHASNVSLEMKGEGHCLMPKYFNELQ